jgi:predicted nucleic acid-binding protein
MLFDTDILIWVERGNTKAAQLINKTSARKLSLYSLMELLQGARNKIEQQQIKNFLFDYQFEVLPLSENIGHRAAIYIGEYGSSSGLRAGDALIAATATEQNLVLATSNKKHFKPIHSLQLKIFTP